MTQVMLNLLPAFWQTVVIELNTKHLLLSMMINLTVKN